MRPADGSSSRLMQRSSVLLPEPLAPMMTAVSPRRRDRSMPLRISATPKDLRRPSMRRTSAASWSAPGMTPLALEHIQTLSHRIDEENIDEGDGRKGFDGAVIGGGN